MDLKQIQAFGGYSSQGIVKRDIKIFRPPLKPESEWLDGKPESDDSAPKESWIEDKASVYVRKRSAQDSYEIMATENRGRPFVTIFRCICNEDGSPFFDSLEQVEQLKDWLWLPLSLVASEVNDLTGKKSRPRTNAGVGSRSLSGAGQSQSGRKSSARKSSSHGANTNSDGATLTP